MEQTKEQFRIPLPIAKTLTRLTDEPRPEVALRIVLEDATEHRLEQVEKKLQEFHQKYNFDFETFKQRWQSGKIENKHTYPVEKDYWDWEGLISRKSLLDEVKQWF